ncbi:UNVERIFIED_CONTAM: hypothetical protein GTU68_066616 [Idotea baltica]|nr:hypothetical protein [Idotea baltica]
MCPMWEKSNRARVSPVLFKAMRRCRFACVAE